MNKQNCRIWGSENPRVIEENPVHNLLISVWCTLWAGGVIGPLFHENDDGETVNVKGERHRNMLRDFLWPQLDNLHLTNMFFQQEGATCHTANRTLEFLQTRFPDRVISRTGDIRWPARSCDLTPLDFFLWSFVKGKVRSNKPQTINDLKQNISQVIDEIGPQLCQKVIDNFRQRQI